MIKESVEAIESLGRRANDRERAHAAAARAWLEGDFAGSVRRYGDILLDYPHDLLALQVAHLGDFYLGASTMLRDRVAQVEPLWDASIPGYNYVLGMYAFGLEETGAYSRAEDAGRRAVELNPKDPWAVHAVAHVMEMQGRVREGIDWLTSRAVDWAPDNAFAFHNWWHLALYYLDIDDISQVLSLYDTRIRPVQSQVPLEMIDASGMLWRLHLRGIDLGARWQALAQAWEASAEGGYYAFNDVHALMAYLGAQRSDLVNKTLGAMESSAIGTNTNAMMTREVGLPMAHALVSFAHEQYAECVDLLLPIRTIAHRFGGSNAQRDLIHLTLVEAALRAGKTKLARALVSERVQLKPASPFNWQLKARVWEQAGERERAARARERAEARRKAVA
jgi:tetratricopeptide (TPR) repeat protein